MARVACEALGEGLMARKWNIGTYRKTALQSTITLPDIIKFAEKVAAAGTTLEEAAPLVIAETVTQIAAEMKVGAEGHRRSGDVLDAIEASPVQRDGDVFYATAGIDLNKHPEAVEAVFQEYGDGHSPAFPDPFIRPATERGKSTFKTYTKKHTSLHALVQTSQNRVSLNPQIQAAYDRLRKSNS